MTDAALDDPSITLKFIGTDASYASSLGYYRVGPNGVLESVTMAYVNAQSVKAGTTLEIDIGADGAQDLGFFLIADGYDENNTYKKMDFTQGELHFVYHQGKKDERPATIKDSASDISLVYTLGGKDTVLKGDIFHSTAAGAGSNLSEDGLNHAKITVTQDQTTQIIKIGFEDLYGLGDKDFNDVVIEIKINPNDAPAAKNDVFNGAEDAPITGNVLADNGHGKDTDADGDVLSVVPATITTANGGKVVVLADGTFTYTPAVNFNGVDTFQYSVKDTSGLSTLGQVTLNVAAVNDGPVAQNDVFNGQEDAAITGNVLGNDSDVDGDTLSVTPATISTTKGGTVVLLANGNFTYTPAANFNGVDEFQYTVLDGKGASTFSAVTLNVAAVNDGPAAEADGFTGYRNNTLSGNVLINDSDLDGDVLTVAPATITTANGGTVVLLANGNYTYTPANGFIGPDGFTYTLLDGHGGSATANVSLVILTNAIAGQIFDDNILGNVHNDVIDAMAGNDTVNAGSGNDIVYGGDGADTLNGEAGDDTLYGGDKNDHLNGGTGADTLYGDAGNDILHGDADDDTLFGGEGVDYLYGDAGNDIINGDGGVDFAWGGDGNDTVNGGEGDDQLYGGTGNDILNGDAGNDVITGNQGNDLIRGGAGDDKLYGAEDDDTVYGDDGIDTLYGNAGNDTVYGGSGDDFVSGDAGNDTLYGDAGKDTIYGGDGNDTLYGGAGEDTLWGQLGADTFKFTTEDLDGTVNRIRDFKTSQGDVLDITDIVSGFTPGVSDIDNFVVFNAPDASGTVSMGVDRDGTGGAYGFVWVARVSTGGEVLDAQTLFDQGHLVA